MPSHLQRQYAAILALFFGACGAVFAHDPGLSSAFIGITPRGVEVVLTFNAREIGGLLEGPREISQDALEKIARRAVALQLDGKAAAPQLVSAKRDGNGNVEFDYAIPEAPRFSAIRFESLLLAELPFGHRQALAARDLTGKEVERAILSAQNPVASFQINGPAAASGSRFLEFLALGIRHILTGYDHLLFLFGLLIVCRAPRPALLLITCFTLAHSLTLALSTFGLVNLPSRFVEATIAASIVYVGIENIVRGGSAIRGRWLLTFAFGLIHGLGFASVLHEMGIARTGAAAVVPLVAFNSGVELGQLGVAAIVLPIIWKLSQRPGFLRVGIPACSFVVAVAGAYWLLMRTLFS